MSRCGTVAMTCAVLERARLRLVGVDDEVLRLRALAVDERRLAAHREAGAAAAAQRRLLELVDELVGGHRPRALEAGAVAADGLVLGELRQVVVLGAAEERVLSHRAPDDLRRVLGLDVMAVAVVDRDDGRVAAAAEALDRAQRDVAVLGRLAGLDPELLLERLDDLLRAAQARTGGSCRSRSCASPTGSRLNMS